MERQMLTVPWNINSRRRAGPAPMSTLKKNTTDKLERVQERITNILAIGKSCQ